MAQAQAQALTFKGDGIHPSLQLLKVLASVTNFALTAVRVIITNICSAPTVVPGTTLRTC